jgi:hypothetical protein
MPKRNMISNLGFGEDATHTTDTEDPSSQLSHQKLAFPLKHPEYVMVDTNADRIAFINHHTNTRSRVKSIIKSWLPENIRAMLFKRSIERFVESYTPKPVKTKSTKTSKQDQWEDALHQISSK